MMKSLEKHIVKAILGLLMAMVFFSCKPDEGPMPPDPNPIEPPVDTTTLGTGPVDFSKLQDTYAQLASPDLTSQWAHYNVHDPSYLVDDEFVYCYNTDVAFGHEIRPGIQIRRSINLVEWEFVGWAFPGIPSRGGNYIRTNGGEPVAGLWAPYIMKVGEEYRLFYSLASSEPRLSTIGVAYANNPRGPFIERGLVVSSLNSPTTHTNAIDPTVIVAPDGKHWMYYGSSWDGIYKLELNPETGLAQVNGDIGVRVAHRGFAGNTINGNIEAPEIIYNPEFDKYYLFIAYDWLETKYNVRVGRSDNPDGPFYDMLGNDMNAYRDDLPMLLAPYRFEGHSGWQGVSHPGVFEKDGTFYIGHQGRPGVNPYFMVMHVRQLFWTEDGWPLVSSQRFATEEESEITEAEIAGEWEHLTFTYQIVPGFANEQTSPNFSFSEKITLDEGGTINGNPGNTWTYNEPWLDMNYNGSALKLRLERGRDWEKQVDSTILYTGIKSDGLAVWGKRLE